MNPADWTLPLLVAGLLLISVLLVLRRGNNGSANGHAMSQLSDVAKGWHDLYDEAAEDRDSWREVAMLRGEQLERAGITPIVRSEADLMSGIAKDLREGFSKDEVDGLAFDIGIKPDDLGGDTLPERARSLVLAASRQRKLMRLVNRMNEERPT